MKNEEINQYYRIIPKKSEKKCIICKKTLSRRMMERHFVHEHYNEIKSEMKNIFK